MWEDFIILKDQARHRGRVRIGRSRQPEVDPAKPHDSVIHYFVPKYLGLVVVQAHLILCETERLTCVRDWDPRDEVKYKFIFILDT